jgi:hypothetical protein
MEMRIRQLHNATHKKSGYPEGVTKLHDCENALCERILFVQIYFTDSYQYLHCVRTMIIRGLPIQNRLLN